ncbi:MAG: diacylglycerol kinase family lipid kinase [Bacteroidales bacterium]|nr:diacylglycerol kinase family lipid kinase [Bacteroidales bacterium]
MREKKEQQRYTFFINPVSGHGSWYRTVRIIRSFCKRNQCIPEFYFTGDEEKIRKILDEKEQEGEKVVFAVGGDGTVNLLARLLVGREMILGIIPRGSGNGLAGHLRIPKQPRKALEMIKNAKVQEIDYAHINGIPFFTTAGVGFDAEVTRNFNQRSRRGLIGYMEAILKVVQNYKSDVYSIEYDGKHKVVNAFLLTFANASEYGNGAYIAPDADTSDGLIDVCLLKPFPATAVPGLVVRLFTKRFTKSKYVETLRARNLTVWKGEPGSLHFDGEGDSHNGKINVTSIPGKLKVMTRD